DEDVARAPGVKSIAAYAIGAGFAFVTLAMFVQGLLPMLAPESRTRTVTRAVRTDLGDVKWVRYDSSDYTPAEARGRAVYIREGHASPMVHDAARSHRAAVRQRGWPGLRAPAAGRRLPRGRDSRSRSHAARWPRSRAERRRGDSLHGGRGRPSGRAVARPRRARALSAEARHQPRRLARRVRAASRVV